MNIQRYFFPMILSIAINAVLPATAQTILSTKHPTTKYSYSMIAPFNEISEEENNMFLSDLTTCGNRQSLYEQPGWSPIRREFRRFPGIPWVVCRYSP